MQVAIVEIAKADVTGRDKDGGSLASLLKDPVVMGGEDRVLRLYKPRALVHYDWETTESDLHKTYAVLDAIGSALLYFACSRHPPNSSVRLNHWKKHVEQPTPPPEPRCVRKPVGMLHTTHAHTPALASVLSVGQTPATETFL